jgi:hypothetical protein
MVSAREIRRIEAEMNALHKAARQTVRDRDNGNH